MTQLGVPVPGWIHDHDRRLPRIRARARGARRPRRGDRRAHRASRGEDRQALRRHRGSAARVGALRRGDLDAGDDGHDPQPRPERRRRGGPDARHRQRTLRRGLVPPADPDVRRGGGRDRRPPLRAGARRSQARPPRQAGRRSRRRRPRAARRDVQEHLQAGDRRRLPAGRARAAAPCGPRGVRVVGQPARAGVPAHVRDPGRPRHRRERPADGLRQHGRALGDGRLLHARPVHRRAARIRRVPGQRAGRRRRGRHPHAAAGRADAGDPARGVRPAAGHDGAARAALPRHAGHRVHRRGREALSPADALGEAHRRGRDSIRRGHGRRRTDQPRGGDLAHRPGAARPAAAPAARSRPCSSRWRRRG